MAVAKKKNRVAEIVDAVEQLELTDFPSAWGALDALSNRTQVDAIQVDPEGVTVSGNAFRGIAPVYVVLEYGGEDGFTTSDSFLGRFKGHFDKSGRPVVDDFSVDTTPFYAGAE